MESDKMMEALESIIETALQRMEDAEPGEAKFWQGYAAAVTDVFTAMTGGVA